MGYKLTKWAQSVEQPRLTKRTRQVLVNMCKVSHDQHHEFGIRGREFIDKYIPDMSYSTYRNNLSILVRNGLLVKVQHGGGRTINGGGTVTCYRIISPLLRAEASVNAPESAGFESDAMSKENHTPWDGAELLADDDAIIEYLKAALEEDDPALLKKAVGNVVRAKSLATSVTTSSGV